MMKRIELKTEQKKILKEEGEANARKVQNKLDELSRELVAQGTEVAKLQLQVKGLNLEIQRLRAEKEHKVRELEEKLSLEETRIRTLLQEREQCENQLMTERKASRNN